MVRKFGSHKRLSLTASLLFALFIIYCFFTPRASSRELKLTQDLAQHFVHHERLTLDVTSTAAQVKETGRMSLAASDLKFDLELVPHDIRSADYRAEEFGSDGTGRPMDPGPVHTFKGIARGTAQGVQLPQLGQARFTIYESGIEGMIITPAEHYFVEPARKYSKEANVTDYVIYKESDVLTNSSGECAVTLSDQVNEKADEFQETSQAISQAVRTPVKANETLDVAPSQIFRTEDPERSRQWNLATPPVVNRGYLKPGDSLTPLAAGCLAEPITSGPQLKRNLAPGCAFQGGQLTDIFFFSGTAGQQVTITMTSSAFDTQLYLYFGPSNALTFAAEDNNGGGGSNSRIPANSGTFILPATATYSIYATSVIPNQTGAYTISFSSQLTSGVELLPINCNQESSLKSVESTTASSIEFANSTTQELHVYWLNFSGQRELVKGLAPGDSYVQNTFLTHPWVVTNSAGVCANIFLPLNEPGRAITTSASPLPTPTPTPPPIPLQELRVATEADNEYVVSMGGSAASSQAILGILNQVEGLFEVELGLTVRVVYQSAWSTTNDPYSSTNASALLGEVANFWNTNRGSVARDLTHMWTGKQLDNATIGTAYLEALCRFTGGGRAAYGLSKGVPGAQQIAITSHELGHNLGATHPNQQVPPVTECDNTVMSSSVGPSSQLTMCQFSRDEIASYLDASVGCLNSGTRQLRFATASTYSAGVNPQSVAAADFNGDGKGDVAVANLESNNVSVLLGTDSGTLQPLDNYVVGSRPVSVVVGDFNGDGKPDLVSAHSESPDVSVLLGSGTGTFQPAIGFPTGTSLPFPRSVVVDDFNNDARQDLAVVSFDTISILLGTGTGSFQPPVSFSVSNASAAAVGDFNGDGNQDLAVAAGGITVLLGNGTGTFQSSVITPAQNARSVVVGDFNGDGKQDVATAGSDFIGVTVLLGTGTGSFGPAVEYGSPDPVWVRVGDFNGDGKQDLATANEFDKSAGVLLGTGSGTFQAQVSYPVGGSPREVAVIDVNGDGIEDLVTPNSTNNNVGVLLGNGDGSFPRAESFSLTRPPNSIAIGDFNGDGFQDLATANSLSAALLPDDVSVLLGQGTGSFHAATNYTVGFRPRSIVIGDFNQDGKQDLGVCEDFGSRVGMFFGTGTGSFQSAVTFSVSAGISSMAVGDFNGDGKQDLAVAHSNFENHDTVGVLLGDGAGNFLTEINSAVGSGPESLVVGDFNGDGHQDLATANSFSDNVSVLLGTGTGGFQSAVNLSVGDSPHSLVVGDFNGDHKQDLAVLIGSLFTTSGRVLLGTGTGSFQLSSSFATPDISTALVVGDFNGDGKQDLVIGSIAGGGLSVLLGTGSGSFQLPVVYAVGPRPTSVKVGDFNNDGKEDLVVGGSLSGFNSTGEVTVLLNISGNFARAPQNDNFPNSRVISGLTGTLGGSTVLATVQPGEPNHAANSNGSGGASIWYQWRAPSTRRFYFQTFSSSFPTVLGVYTGSSVNALTPVAVSTSSVAEYVEFDAVEGATYQIAIDGLTGDTGRTVLNWNTGSLKNDNFAFAREIRGSSGSVNGNNTNFTLEPDEPTLPGPSATAFSAWYSWTAPNTGKVSFSTTPCSDTTRLLGAYTGNFLDILVPVAANFDGYRDFDDPGICDNRSLRFNAVAGASYRIQLRSAAGAPFALTWNYANPPPNDNFANALILAGNSGSLVGTNRDATKEPGEPNHAGGPGGASIWYRWTASSDGPVTFDTIGFRNQTANSFRYLTGLIAVYTGSDLNSLTPEAANATDNKVTFNATAGTTYQIAIDSAPYSGGGYLPGIVPLHWGAKQVANDDFVNAQSLTASGSLVPLLGSNAGATKEIGEPNHQGSSGGTSVWYRWTALSTGSVSFVTNPCITCTLSSSNVLVGVYNGSYVSALTAVPVTADNNHTFVATRGATYFIAVDSQTGSGGTYEFSLVSANISARNDAFANAQVLSGSAGAVAGDNSGASKETAEPNHANNIGGASVWFQWKAPASGLYTFDSFGSNFDTLLGVYTGDVVSALTVVASSDNTGSLQQSRIIFDAKVNTTYFIAVDGKSNGVEQGTGLARSQAGFILLNWNNLPPPVNDNFADAQILTGTSGNVSGRNTVASKEGGEPNHAGGPGGVSVWYQWTAPSSGNFSFNTFGSDFNTLLGVYTGADVNSLTSISSNDDVGGVTQSRVTFNAVAGTVYYIAVDGSPGVPGNVTPFSGNVVLSWFPETGVSNDNFLSAQLLNGTSGSLAATNAGATKEAGESNHAGDRGGRSMWYSWTAPSSGPVLFTTAGSDFDTVLAIYTGGNVNQLTAVASNDDSSYTDNMVHILTSSLTFTATAGTTYMIAVDGSGGRFGNFALRWGPDAKISGQVSFIGGVCGSDKRVTMLLSGEDTRAVTFTGSGTYTFQHLRVGGNYSVRGVSEISANCLPLFLERAQNSFPLAGDVLDANFVDDGLRGGGSTSNITGHIQNATGVGLYNVAIALTGTASRTVYTDSAGLYLLPNLPAGTYQVTPSKAGAVFTPGAREFTFASGQTILDADFVTQDSFNISGQASDENGASLIGVTVTLDNGTQPVSVQTDVNGFYAFDAAAGGSYTLTAAKSGLSFTPASKSISSLNANQKNVDFTVTQTHILTVASVNPSSSVNIVVSPNDKNSQGSGATQFTRTYNPNTSVTLTAPANVGDNVFQKWVKDGVDHSINVSTNVMMDADHTMTAVYLTTTTQTPAGQNVTVQLNGVTVSFINVVAAGTTTILPINPATAGQLPTGYQLTANSMAFDISSTASVQPPISVCFNVPSVTDSSVFGQLRLLHNENGTLVDRTSRQDFATKMICASVNSLSPFVLASTSIPLLQLLLEESGAANHAAALDSVLFVRDPFAVINQQNVLNPGPDRNTRVLVFAKSLQLAENEAAAAIVVNLVDSANQTFDVPAENVWFGLNVDFSQISFRLPDTLAPGACTIQIRVHGQVSNSAFILIRP